MLSLLLGIVVGAVMALTGAGGGVLSVPLLMFALHLDMRAAAPASLLALTVAAGIGALLGLHEGVVRYRAALLMAGCGALASPVGLWLGHRLPAAPLSAGFALVLLVVAWRLVQRGRRSGNGAEGLVLEGTGRGAPCRLDQSRGTLVWTLPCARVMALAGAVAGLLSGLLGVGGGFLLVPAMGMATDLPMRSIVATSLTVITLVSFSAAVSAAAMGLMPWALALPFAVGAALGLLGARRLAQRLAGRQLQRAFALLCVLVALLLLWRLH